MARLLLSAVSCLLIGAAACADAPIRVSVQQPIEFPHAAHIRHFASGQHRNERVAMHLKIYGTTEAPPELTEGRCADCHDDLAERQACAVCHVPFQNPALRGQRELRRCVGCHRGAWGTSAATIPSAGTCLACHEAGMRLAQGAGAPRVLLTRAGDRPAEPVVEDVPWVRITTMPPNVYFSHTAHVRYASMACTECHQDVTALSSPPDRVRTLTMSECLTCHARRGASTDCLTCHK